MKLLFIITLLAVSTNSLADSKRFDKQLENLSGKKAPLVAQKFLDKGYEELKIGKIDEAVKNWEKAIKHYKLFELYYFIIADTYYNADRHLQACKYYLKTVNADPNNAQARMRLGICEIRNKNWNKAITYFNESLELSPNQALAYYYIAASYGVLKEHVKAKVNLQRALLINPNLIIDDTSVLFKYL